MNWQLNNQIASIPMRVVGPLKIIGSEVDALVPIPLATFETPLWASTHRGARVCTAAGGISAIVIDERMTRSVLLEASTLQEAHEAVSGILKQKEDMQKMISETSRYARLLDIHSQQVGNLIYLRFEFNTADAAGHNMTTLACDCLLAQIKKPLLSMVF